jgi:hypothetical protein
MIGGNRVPLAQFEELINELHGPVRKLWPCTSGLNSTADYAVELGGGGGGGAGRHRYGNPATVIWISCTHHGHQEGREEVG